MPEYDYGCPSCGPFTATRPMAEYDQPCACPDCGEAAPRVILSVPFLAGTDGLRRNAADAGQASGGAASPFAASHGGGCACCRPRAAGARAWASSGE